MPQLPVKFIEELNNTGIPATAVTKLIDALTEGKPSISVRANRQKGFLPGEAVRQVEWCERGRYLDSRPLFTLMPQLHQGRFYVQDASSMFIVKAIDMITRLTGTRPLTVLDACAAPGGKTTAIIDSLPDGSVVVANEFDRRRAVVLKENLVKWGNPDVLVSTGDTSQYARVRDTFDIIAVDAPCSGEGMMRKEEVAVEQWSPGLVDECSRLQREIVGNLWNALKPGGFMIYSTCTFNRHEDEENVKWITDTYDCQSVEIDISRFKGIVKTGDDKGIHCYRFMPGLVEGEGLFMSVLQKAGDLNYSKPDTPAKNKKESGGKPKFPEEKIKQWIKPGIDLKLSLSPDGISIEGTSTAADIIMKKLIKNGVKNMRPILTIATIKGKDIIPDHALAMNEVLNIGAFETEEVDKERALAYLRREAIEVGQDKSRGYVLITFDNVPLGFVKNLGNRTNNLYPQNWRILMNVR